MRDDHEQQLALECLKLARAVNNSPDTGIVVKNAQKMLNFVLGVDAGEARSPASVDDGVT